MKSDSQKNQTNAIYWLRNDLRLSDNPTLCAAAANHKICFVYVHSPEEEGHWQTGGASKWWLHYSLEQFDKLVAEKYRARLLILKGNVIDVLPKLAKKIKAEAVYFSKRYEPWGREQENAATAALNKCGIDVQTFDSACLFPPDKVTTALGQPYKVFTPFWRNVSEHHARFTTDRAPVNIELIENLPDGIKLAQLKLLPTIDWAGGIEKAWTPGEMGARENLKTFVRGPVDNYLKGRNLPAEQFVSRLSPHLHFGEISPRVIWQTVAQHRSAHSKAEGDCEQYLKELAWREFAIHLLYHFPHTQDKPLRENFERFPWEKNEAGLKAWQKGNTGYPIVDAGMRELWVTGWMHNRVRMIVASFLVKDLRISWLKGAEWFWDTLVDADLASNTLGWQWTAGCGADAAPYFRIFNPLLQGEKFDPDGEYVKKWVPELKKLPAQYIHQPSAAPPAVLKTAGVELGKTYPKPIVDHSQARKHALSALATIGKEAI